MGIFTDTVPRELYDALQTRYDALLEHYHALRMIGNAPVKPAVLIPPKRDSGQLAVLAAERISRTPGAVAMVEELMQAGKTEPEACRIVAEMQNVGRGKTLPPSTGQP